MKNPFKNKTVGADDRHPDATAKSHRKFLKNVKRKKGGSTETLVNPPDQQESPSLKRHGFDYEESHNPEPGLDDNVTLEPLPTSKKSKKTKNSHFKTIFLVAILLLLALFLIMAYLLPKLLGAGEDNGAQSSIENTANNSLVIDNELEANPIVNSETETLPKGAVELNTNPEADPEVKAAIEAALNNQANKPVNSQTTTRPNSDTVDTDYEAFLRASETPIFVEESQPTSDVQDAPSNDNQPDIGTPYEPAIDQIESLINTPPPVLE